jgi:parallel beta-helix repeat protein
VLPSPAATIHVPADQPTIQAGVDAAQDGDTVLVAPGTYVENIDFLGKAITVQSTDGPTVTIIDGSQPGSGSYSSVVYFRSGEKTDSVLKGFMITGGTGEYVSYRRMFGKSFAYLFGGGIYCGGSSPTITGNIITFNSVRFNPAGKHRGVVVLRGYGGGIYAAASGAIIDNNQIDLNMGAYAGGGIYVSGSGVTISQNTISDNQGGGIWLEGSDDTLCVNNTVVWNFSIGGIVSHHSDSAIIGNLISNNLSVIGSGAGIRSSHG